MAKRILKLMAQVIGSAWILAVLWVVPPYLGQLRHRCPVRPDGVREAQAIPAFARKYNYNCEICHSPSFPKLNDFGNRFRDNGYQTGTDKDVPAADSPLAYFPISLRTTVGYNSSHVQQSGQKINSGSFGFTGLDILSFGLLEKNVSFGIVYTPGLQGAGFNAAPSGGEGDLEAAYLQLSNVQRFLGLGDANYLMNLKVGRFEPDIPFSEHRSPTLNTPFVMYHYQPGVPYTTNLGGLSTQGYANPNDYALGDNQPGAQLYGQTNTPGAGTFRYAFSGLSTSGLNKSGSGGGHSTNFYGHLTQSIGGYGASGGDRIGVFAAAGNIPTAANDACPTCDGVGESEKPFSRVGADLSVTIRNQVNLFGAWMRARDTKGMFASQGIATAQKSVWDGGFAEIDWAPLLPFLSPTPNCLFAYRYDAVRNRQQGDSTFAKNFNNVDSHTLLVRYFPFFVDRGGLALHLEYNQFRDKGVASDGGDQTGNSVLTGFDLAY